jgi:flavin-dependent dehydrogenase
MIVEKDDFPRFHTGESMTGECGAIVRQLGLEDQMAARGYPIKHATDVYGAGGNNKFRVPVMARSEKGALRASTTWQVRRSDFDAMLLEAAFERGAIHVRGTAKHPVRDLDGRIRGLKVERPDGSEIDIETSMIIDASGRGTWASRVGLSGPKTMGNYAAQTAVFSHAKGAIRDPAEDSGNTIIFYSGHLHWAWFIPIDEETVSIGIVSPNNYVKESEGTVEDFYETELRTLNPDLARRIHDIELAEPIHTTANFSYEVADYVGQGFLAIGDAHRFIDPIFSFGLYVTMAEAQSAAYAVADVLENPSSNFDEHRAFADRGQATLQSLVDASWANPLAFGYMVHHSSYSDDLVDIFAGRIYDKDPPAAVKKLNDLIASGT